MDGPANVCINLLLLMYAYKQFTYNYANRFQHLASYVCSYICTIIMLMMLPWYYTPFTTAILMKLQVKFNVQYIQCNYVDAHPEFSRGHVHYYVTLAVFG